MRLAKARFNLIDYKINSHKCKSIFASMTYLVNDFVLNHSMDLEQANEFKVTKESLSNKFQDTDNLFKVTFDKMIDAGELECKNGMLKIVKLNRHTENYNF